MPLESGRAPDLTHRTPSPTLRVHRASITETNDYFSRPVARQSFKRNASDTIMAAFASFERGTPFGQTPPGNAMMLPQYSPVPDEPNAPVRRGSATNLWAVMRSHRSEHPMLVSCMALTLAFGVGLSAGFILGIYVAINHLDPPLGQQ